MVFSDNFIEKAEFNTVFNQIDKNGERVGFEPMTSAQ
jgi:hypothetical protein